MTASFESSFGRRGFMFVLSSPSGAGKTTLSRLLLEKDDNLSLSISATTRPKRSKETDGEDYFFLEKDDFMTKLKSNEFLEHAKIFGHYYGTPKEKVQKSLTSGIDVLFDVDWQGTHQLTQNARDDVVSVFILPPTMQELERRLRSRAQDSEEVILERMSKANREISHWYGYDYVIVNKSIEESLDKIYNILIAERLRRIRQNNLSSFVEELLSQNKMRLKEGKE